MKPASVLNDVLGPVMRGPSSSHTAGAFHVGRLARSLLGGEPARAAVWFDPSGSYGACYRQQGADRAFAVGLMGWTMADERFFEALRIAADAGLALEFGLRTLPDASHPNAMEIELSAADGRALSLRANSVGGGAVEIVRLAGWPVRFTGDAYEVAVETARGGEAAIADILARDGALLAPPECQVQGDRALVTARGRAPLPNAALGGAAVWQAEPVFFIPVGQPLFASAGEMVDLAAERDASLGRVALDYEAGLLGLSQEAVLAEVARRLDVMELSVRRGLTNSGHAMRFLEPSAGAVFDAEAAGRLVGGGLHTRAAARALAVMQVNSSMGVVCAAPTGGSAGVLPGVLVTLIEERALSREAASLAFLAAGAVGVVVANRATFAAEVAGCQVEIGAAGAMAAAAAVETAGGTARQAADAAAIAFQNSMGSVCDLVQGAVEIPCHTRNAAAAASALVCADLVLGGYRNPIPLDETIDAAYAVGRMLPAELRCTALGGLAATPSAQALKPRAPGGENP